MPHLRNGEFGRYTNLNEISTMDSIIISSSSSGNGKVPKPTRTIKISEQLYRRFVGHSRRYYNVESYENILENLIKCYEEHNQDTRWYHNTDR